MVESRIRQVYGFYWSLKMRLINLTFTWHQLDKTLKKD